MSDSIYDADLPRCGANHAPLTPLGFLARAAEVYPDLTAVVDGDARKTWGEVYQRCRRMASALQRMGLGKNDTLSVLAPNSLAAYEMHFAAPMAGGVLNAINTRLDAKTIAFILEHGESKMLMADAALLPLAEAALKLTARRVPLVEIHATPASVADNNLDYETLINSGDPAFDWQPPADEWDAISLNYTSGTTGDPKGVVYHHRGAYLNALSNAVGWHMPPQPVYLWTLPMFHCNGWCFPWTLAALGGVNICLRQVDAARIYAAIRAHDVTHFCGAPVVMNMLINASAKEKGARLKRKVHMMTAAAPPPASVLATMESAGFDVTHVYGLTETYGPAVICAWRDEWRQLDADAQARKKSRQGVRYHALESLDVCDAESLQPVARDAEQIGEVMFRGNIVMKGYLKNPRATEQAFRGDRFHSGDLGVMHADNYVQLKDRSKDIIISGGENISSIEVEDCLYRHPEVTEAAVVAMPDAHWGETPCAFVALAADARVDARGLIDYCRENLPHFMCPTRVVFGELPKTSTGKVRKFQLRESAVELAAQKTRAKKK